MMCSVGLVMIMVLQREYLQPFIVLAGEEARAWLIPGLLLMLWNISSSHNVEEAQNRCCMYCHDGRIISYKVASLTSSCLRRRLWLCVLTRRVVMGLMNGSCRLGGAMMRE